MSTEQSTAQPPLAPDADKSPHHASLGARIRNYFLTGLVLVGPVFITGYLLWWFVN